MEAVFVVMSDFLRLYPVNGVPIATAAFAEKPTAPVM
jgi:hypothetical protein